MLVTQQSAPAPSKRLAWGYYSALVVAAAVWSVTPLSWLTVARTGWQCYRLGAAVALPNPWRSPLATLWLGYALVEVPFSVYLRRLIRRAASRPIQATDSFAVIEAVTAHCLRSRTQPAPSGDSGASAAVAADVEQRVRAGQAALAAAGRPKLVYRDLSTCLDDRVVTEQEASRLRRQMSRFFLGKPWAEVGYENFCDYIAYFTFATNLDALRHDERKMAFVRQVADLFLARLKLRLDVGSKPRTRVLKYGTQPIGWRQQRPFAVYALTNVLSAMTISNMIRREGFRYVRHGKCEFLIKPAHGAAAAARAAGAGSQAKGQAEQSLPILFLHGLGIGIGQYQPWLKRLSRHEPGACILLQPYVSCNLFSPRHLDRPSFEEMVEGVSSVMHDAGFEEATVVSQSNGTTFHPALQRALPKLFRRNILVDPVAEMVWEGELAWKVMMQPWTSFADSLITFMIGNELGVAYTTQRQFRWMEQMLFPEELPIDEPGRVQYLLSENDFLIDFEDHVAYLRSHGLREEQITVLPRSLHGEAVMEEGEAMRKLARYAGMRE